MAESTDQYVIARNVEALETLFYPEVFFKCKAVCGGDEVLAKGLCAKVFDLGRQNFSLKNNTLAFLEGILLKLTQFQESDRQ